MTLSFETLQAIFANIQAQKERVSGAYIHGANMEGPYIAMSKKGAQNAKYVRNPDKDEFFRLYKGCGGCIRVVILRPSAKAQRNLSRLCSPFAPFPRLIQRPGMTKRYRRSSGASGIRRTCITP